LFVALLQTFLGFLDLAALAVVGMLGAVAVSGLTSQAASGATATFLHTVGLDEKSFQTQVAYLGSFVGLFLVIRTLVTMHLTRKMLHFLSVKGAEISVRAIATLLTKSLLLIQKRSEQETLYAVTYGVSRIMVGVLGSTISALADTSLLLLMSIGLLIYDPIIAISTFTLFALIGLILYLLMNKKAHRLGELNTTLNIRSNEKILEVLSSYREAVVRNRRDFYAAEIAKSRISLAATDAEISYMPLVSKYVLEVSVVVGALVICAIQFLLKDASQAVAALAVFMTAGTRIAPAILRLQQSALTIKTSSASAQPTIALLRDLGELTPSIGQAQAGVVGTDHSGFIPTINFNNVCFRYPGAVTQTLKNLTLSIPPGSVVAIVGPSGAGKTTLIDVILGIISPNSGTVEISGLIPTEAIKKWPGAISYIPQKVFISNGTVKENVALGYNPLTISDEEVLAALMEASLPELAFPGNQGLDKSVGDQGAFISGGQRQRLGIARGLFTSPKLLVLDEATSALDGKTEAEIMKAIHDMSSDVTVLMIAHRLSTVRSADVVVYMANGAIDAIGTFGEVREVILDFDEQAKLMGL
jgi:ABC-type multidrug transport system fused ATPase/permease subunit